MTHDAEMAQFMYRAETDYESLDAPERWRAEKFFEGFFSMMESDYFIFRQGVAGEPLEAISLIYASVSHFPS